MANTMVFSAVAGAGKVLGLDKERLRHALGIAGANVPLEAGLILGMARPRSIWGDKSSGDDVSQQSVQLSPAGRRRTTPHFKYGDYGWCAMGGVMAAMLAAKGFTAFPHILDEGSSFWDKFQVGKDFSLATKELGKKWLILDTTFKPWPSCRLTHPALTAFERVLREEALKAEEIERVTLYCGSVVKAFSPQDTLDVTSSQFNFPHPAAMLAFGIPAGPLWFSEEVLSSEGVKEFKKRVFCEMHPETRSIGKWVEDGQWRKMPGGVEVEARGRRYVRETEYSKGDPWDKATYFRDEDIVSKFKGMAMPLASSSARWQRRVEEIIERGFKLEEITEINSFTSLLAP